MALAVPTARRLARLSLFLLPPHPPFHSLPSIHFIPISFSYSSSSLPHRSHRSLEPRLPNSLLSPLLPALDHEPSDFESDPDESTSSFRDFDRPTSPLDDSDLPSFLQLLSHAKSLSLSPKDALTLLRESSGIKPTRDLVCRALWELRRDWESAILAFRWGEECLLDCPKAWHLMIWVVGKQGRFDVAWFLVRRMYRKGILSRRAMVIMIQRYSAANEASKAIRTFHAIEKFKLHADSTLFLALLRALCKNKNIEEAEETLLGNKKFFPLTTEGFNIILDGWCNITTDVIEAKRVWREMSNYCIVPNGNSYSHMISCFSKAGNLFDSLRLYDEMKKRGWIPGLAVYNSLVYVLTKENCMKDAWNVFDKISEAGLQLDVETFNSMIYPLCEAHKLEEAWMVMEDMVARGIAPNIGTYHAFIKVEGIDETLRLLRRMKDTGCGPNRFTFLMLVLKFFSMNESENALRIWSEMRRYGVGPDSLHYMALVQGLVKFGWMPKALEFYNEMKDKGFSPDPRLEKLFKAFIANNKDHWGRTGKDYIVSRGGKHWNASLVNSKDDRGYLKGDL